MTGHECSLCPECLHDGHKCCGCYDGACCQDHQWGRMLDGYDLRAEFGGWGK